VLRQKKTFLLINVSILERLFKSPFVYVTPIKATTIKQYNQMQRKTKQKRSFGKNKKE